MHASESPERKAAADTLFAVYLREGGTTGCHEFAIGERGTCVVVIDCSRTCASRVTEADLPTAVSMLAGKLKQGYRRSPQRMYFNPRSGGFTLIHPDLDWKGVNWLLAAVPRSTFEEAADQVGELVSTLGADLILPEEVSAWRTRQQLNAIHLVAFDDHPAWSLALAQLAHEQGWLLRASSNQKAACPDVPPSLSPREWTAWLSTAFDRKVILANMAGFGWTAEQESTITAEEATNNGCLSALL
jgi:hypothetical protein